MMILQECPQPIDWKWKARDGQPKWDRRFDEANNSKEDSGGIYSYSDDEMVEMTPFVYIDDVIGGRKDKGLFRFWENSV